MHWLARMYSWALGALDTIYFAFSKLSDKFFVDGFGDAETSRQLETFYKEVAIPQVGQLSPLSDILSRAFAELNDQTALLQANEGDGIRATLGSFTSPMADFLPEASKTCRFLLLQPPQGVKVRGACVVMPATGDMGFKLRRKLYADQLARAGIIGILVTAPYYGTRMPPGQSKWFVRSVQALLLQAETITVEANCLLQWARVRYECDVGITGISYGGAMSCLAALMHRGDLAVVPYMGCPSPGQPFAFGVMKESVAWDALKIEADMPGVSPHTTDIRVCLKEYLDFATDLEGVRRQTLKNGANTGFRALVQVQAQDDAFVCMKEGQGMYEIMSKGHSESSRFSAITGGHVTGFLKAPSTLVPAVLLAFDVLKRRV